MLDRQHPRLAQTYTQVLANPAAGTDFTLTVPTGVWWRITTGHGTFNTSSTVANRNPAFNITDGSGNSYWRAQTPTNETASGFYEHLFSIGENSAQTANTALAGLFCWPLPKIWLPPGWKFGPTTGSIQAADFWQVLQFLIAEIGGAPTGATPLLEV